MAHRLFSSEGILAALAGVSLAAVMVLAGCGVTAGAGGTGQPGSSGASVAYDAHPSSILAQLFPSPGFIFPSVNGVPSWTLYGDGTLVFASGTSATASTMLLQAKLSTDQVQHILDVVVSQHAFFASDKPSYGHVVPDVGTTLLTVNAAGQSKTISLYGEEGSQLDAQTKNVFAIERFLQGYHPANAQAFTPRGVAVLVYPATGAWQTLPVRAWPYSTVDLAQVAAAECPYLQPGASCAPSSARGILPVYGTSGTSLLAQLGSRAQVAQNGSTYLVLIWPLMPDVPPPNMHPAASAIPAPHIRVVSGGHISEWPLMSGNGMPVGA